MFSSPASFFRKSRKIDQIHSSDMEDEPDIKPTQTDAPTVPEESKGFQQKRVHRNICDRVLLGKRGYDLGDSIGEGTFSKVRKAYSRYHDNYIAVKIITRDSITSDFLDRFLPREIDIIKNLKHRNVCRYFNTFDLGHKVYISMEYADRGDLLEYVIKKKVVSENRSRSIFQQVIAGLKYLHGHGILHRDLKCENILLTKEKRALITDFGFAKRVDNMEFMSNTFCGSAAYAPIEILQGITYDGRLADVWSCGCILYIMTTGTMPFDDNTKAVQIVQMKKGPKFTCKKQNLSDDLKTLIKKILEADVSKRPTLVEIEKDGWLSIPESTKNWGRRSTNEKDEKKDTGNYVWEKDEKI